MKKLKDFKQCEIVKTKNINALTGGETTSTSGSATSYSSNYDCLDTMNRTWDEHGNVAQTCYHYYDCGPGTPSEH